MARPLRIEFDGALYHVTSREDRREDIFEGDEDRRRFLNLLAEVAERFGNERWHRIPSDRAATAAVYLRRHGKQGMCRLAAVALLLTRPLRAPA
jgi:hypothetical protein